MDVNSLIKQCQQGDSAAFGELLGRYYDTIFRFAYRWCGDQNNAEDITQNACMKLAKALPQFRFEANFTSWLYQLTINCAKDFYKSPRQHNTREQHDPDLAQQLGHNDTQERRLHAQQILNRINELPEELRDTLVLVFVSGMNHQQAAAELGIKESTISWRVHEARKRLKQLFDNSSLMIDSQSELVRGTS